MAGALSGIRIADLTIITAGAAATQILADFGAEVVKVEAGRYPDPFRNWGSGLTPPAHVERPWDASPPFNVVNRNKLGISLDLKHPRGREVFLRLVAISDVVTENFRRGVMERLGLGYQELRKVKPDLVMVSFSSQGNDGPEAGYASYGSTLDALSGLMSVTGYDENSPVWSGNDVNYPDQVVSLLGAGIILAGLRYRRVTGRGIYIDLSQRELVTAMLGEIVLDFTVNGRRHRPAGGRHPSMVPHGCYPCRGEDAWVAIAIENDRQWAALCRLMGWPELAADPRFATLPARWVRAAEVDELVRSWTSGRDKAEAMRLLQEAGVPAGAVLNGRDLLEDPHLKARGFYVRVDHPVGGPQLQRTWPFRLSRTPGGVRRPAPCLGEHTRQVLSGLLGYSDGEVAELEAAGVISYTPAKVRA